MKKVFIIGLVLAACFFAGCDNGSTSGGGSGPQEEFYDETITMLTPYANITYIPNSANDRRVKVYNQNQYNRDDILTFIFNKNTVLRGSEDIQARIMEDGKNPGLGVRSLHAQGITGKGVNVAIIDQNLLLNHPEFKGKIAAYYDTGCGMPANRGSMHAPAVVSLLVGDTTGTAPGAKVFVAAAPSWNGDSEFYARALYWIIEENNKLPDGQKIRVVSISAAPSGQGSPFTKNQNIWDQAVLAAQQNGILVLDCRSDPKTGIVMLAFYDPEDPENAAACIGGFPTRRWRIPDSQVGVPASYRTTAEEYWQGLPSYAYFGEGGLSWAIPYAAGILALGWQVNPNLGNDQIVQILFSTCSRGRDGSPIINPVAFIDAVKRTL